MQNPNSPDATLLSVRAQLDAALTGLLAIDDPDVALADTEESIAAALQHVYEALASTGDYQAFHRVATSALERTRAALSALQRTPSRDLGAHMVMRHLARVLAALSKPLSIPLDPALDLPNESSTPPGPPATVGEPRVLDLARTVLAPAVPLSRRPTTSPPLEALEIDTASEPPSRAKTLADVEALVAEALAENAAFDAAQDEAPGAPEDEPPPIEPVRRADDETFVRLHFGVALERREVLFLRAKSFFEDLAMMSLMRQPDPGDVWFELEPVEHRLLARVDAIAACGGDVLPQLVKLQEDRPVPDPEMTWALIFLYGSIAGDDARDQVMRLVRTAPLSAEPAIFDSVADALALAPHGGITLEMLKWLKSPDPTRRRMAVRVLGRRGALSTEECLAATRDPELEVVIEAARALTHVARSPEPESLAGLLRHDDARVVEPAFEACIAHRSESGLRRGLELLAEGRGAFARAALYVALSGRSDVYPLLRAAAERDPAPEFAEALGFYGHPGAMDILLARLSGGDASAVGALQRITGASLTADDPEPEYEEDDLPFVRPFAPPEPELELTDKHELWDAWWRRYGARAEPTKRYRYGHAWSPRDNLWELDLSAQTPGERTLSWLELVARTGRSLPFDPRCFVARQRAQIGQWRDYLSTRHEATSGWPCKLGSMR